MGALPSAQGRAVPALWGRSSRGTFLGGWSVWPLGHSRTPAGPPVHGAGPCRPLAGSSPPRRCVGAARTAAPGRAPPSPRPPPAPSRRRLGQGPQDRSSRGASVRGAPAGKGQPAACAPQSSAALGGLFSSPARCGSGPRRGSGAQSADSLGDPGSPAPWPRRVTAWERQLPCPRRGQASPGHARPRGRSFLPQTSGGPDSAPCVALGSRGRRPLTHGRCHRGGRSVLGSAVESAWGPCGPFLGEWGSRPGPAAPPEPPAPGVRLGLGLLRPGSSSP